MNYFKTGILFIGMTTLIGCKKEDMSKYATKDDLRNYQPSGNYVTNDDLNSLQANVYDFSLVFGPTTKEGEYIMPKHSLYGKLAFVYLDTGSKDWVLLPYYKNIPGYVPVNYIGVIDEILEKIKVKTDRGDNQAGSPWASVVIKDFRVVVIEKSELSRNPNLNFKNYEEIAENFDLKW